MKRTFAVYVSCAVLFPVGGFAAQRTGFAADANSANKALIVSVGHGLPGLEDDVAYMEEIATNPSYAFEVEKLAEEEGTKENILAKLESVSHAAGENGSFFFYYTGHGSPGELYVQDGGLEIDAIRGAMEAGRKDVGPLKRLTFISDSCYAGSLNDHLRNMVGIGVRSIFAKAQAALVTTQTIVRKFASKAQRENYWKTLFVIASSKEDETSMAGPNGSMFTVALHQAFTETVEANGTVGEMFDKSVEYTTRHTPVARFVPESLRDEKLVD